MISGSCLNLMCLCSRPWEVCPFLNRDRGVNGKGSRWEEDRQEERREGEMWSVYKINEKHVIKKCSNGNKKKISI